MNKREASVLLFIITFFAAIQYAFLSGVPASVSNFAFLCITNLIGFCIVLALFSSELFRIDRKTVFSSLILSAELFGFNLFVLLGSSGTDSTVTSCVLSSYFVFIPLINLIFFKQKAEKNTVIGIIAVVIGLFFMMNCNASGLLNRGILFLVAADVCFAVYILTTGRFTGEANPALLAMGQMFFSFLFALVCWVIESAATGSRMTLPADPAFWGSVLFISIFIRCIYSIVQIYAQRYISPLNTSLIFSTEIIMTMLASPLMARLFRLDSVESGITLFRTIGAMIMVAGILISDSSVIEGIRETLQNRKNSAGKRTLSPSEAAERSRLVWMVIVSAAVWFMLDLPVQLTGFLRFGSYIGIKGFLPATLGLLFGPYGIIGALIGSGLTGLILRTPFNELFLEWLCIIIPGMGMWTLWHRGSSTHKVHFKRFIHYFKYLGILLLTYSICGWASMSLIPGGAFKTVLLWNMAISFLLGIPVITIFSGILCIRPVIPPSGSKKNGEAAHVSPGAESFDALMDTVVSYTGKRGVGKEKQEVIKACIEETVLRIRKVRSDAEINVLMNCDGMFSAEFVYDGNGKNPLQAMPGEDIASLAGLTLLKQRALQTSYYERSGSEHVFIVINDGLVSLLNSSPRTLEAFNDSLEAFSSEKHIQKKKVFELQSCIEEMYIYITGVLPEADITVCVNYDGSYSADLIYIGEKCNPLRPGKGSSPEDTMGLSIVRHRALRAGYSFSHGENRLHIVI